MHNYRGIKVYQSVPLYFDNGTLNPKYSKTLDKLADRLEQTGYTLLKPYRDSKTPIKARCDKGHHMEIQPNNFVTKKTRCMVCFRARRFGHEGLWDEFKGIVKRYKLKHEQLDFSKGVLHGLKQEYLFTCPKGHHVYDIPYNLVKYHAWHCLDCTQERFRKS